MKKVLFRYNEKTGEWKKMELGISRDSKGLLLILSQGIKGEKNPTSIIVTLSLEEAYFLVHVLQLYADHLLHNGILNGNEE